MITALLGAQWGDEGKGKSVDIEAARADIVARFQGGPNAGHTLVIEGKKTVLHQVPSGIIHPKPLCLLGGGMVIDPVKLLQEIRGLQNQSIDVTGRILIAQNAPLILPIHRAIDALADKDNRIGTTKSGIGPAYADKINRIGLQAEDILLPGFEGKVRSLTTWHIEQNPALSNELFQLGGPETVLTEFLDACYAIGSNVCDGIDFIHTALDQDKLILAEGAQGTLLDISNGNYPFVTSSNTITGGVCTGLGVPASAINRVIGITKAYATRVGTGPFPTEQKNDIGKLLQKRGDERGATTGRDRRCGWLDLPLLQYAHRINGFTELHLAKLDILDTLPEIQVCVGYVVDGIPIKASEVIAHLETVTPRYITIPGWQSDIRGILEFEKLPRAARNYVLSIESAIGVPITMIGTGPDRDHCIKR